MSKTALFFPGQASQYVGMGKDLYDSSAEVRRLYEMASEYVGDDIAALSFNGPSEKLTQTRYTQPAILIHSLAALTVLGEHLPDFDYAAGHSLGEYAALAVTGAVSYEDAIKAVARRAALMESSCRQNPGTMAAIIGLTGDRVDEVCQGASIHGTVVAANYNSSTQTVVSGEEPAVTSAVTLATQAGAKRAVMLEVGGAFHSPLMGDAGTELGQYLESIAISAPSGTVVANVTAEPVVTPDAVKKLLIEQVTAPVRWAQTMAFLKENDVTRIIEIGPGKVLSSLAKREMKPEQLDNLDTVESIRAFAPVSV
jgi:[acyl-carrier-protein] S-malonyltransferase